MFLEGKFSMGTNVLYLHYIHATNYHKLILMQATAKTAMGSGFRRNSVSKLKLKNRCTGSTNCLTW